MARPRVAPVGLAVLAGLLLAACSSPSSSSSSSSTTAVPASSTTTPAGSPTTRPTGSTTTTSTRPAGPTPCPTPKLAASIYGTNGAAGTIQVTIALTSSATVSCTLGGYPGLQLVDAGHDLPTTVVRGGSYSFTALPPSVVTVAPGQAAYFNLGYSDVPTGTETSCPTSTDLGVTPPNSYTSLTVAAQLAPCSNGSITVSPVFSGTGPAAQTRAVPQ